VSSTPDEMVTRTLVTCCDGRALLDVLLLWSYGGRDAPLVDGVVSVAETHERVRSAARSNRLRGTACHSPNFRIGDGVRHTSPSRPADAVSGAARPRPTSGGRSHNTFARPVPC
jgi:hypothetical protein